MSKARDDEVINPRWVVFWRKVREAAEALEAAQEKTLGASTPSV